MYQSGIEIPWGIRVLAQPWLGEQKSDPKALQRHYTLLWLTTLYPIVALTTLYRID